MSKGANIRGYRLEVYVDEDGSWVADVPDLPGCTVAAEEPEDLMQEAEDAIDAWIEAAEAVGRPVPAPTARQEEYSGRFVLRIPKSLHRRLAVQAGSDGVSLNAYCSTVLAEGIGTARVAEVVLRAIEHRSAWEEMSIGSVGGDLLYLDSRIFRSSTQLSDLGPWGTAAPPILAKD